MAVLDNIRSMHNVGSIFRTANAAGLKRIYLCGITPPPVDRFGKIRQQMAKVSLGAEKYVEWEHSATSLGAIKKLKLDGYKIFAVEQSKNSVPYYRAASGIGVAARIALILGNEVRGLPPSILRQADKVLEIPMAGAMVRQARHPRHRGVGKESLNVSVAFGIVVFRFKHPG